MWWSARSPSGASRRARIAVGSLGGVAAASRGECDIAPVHLIDPASGQYNEHLRAPGLTLGAGLAAHAGRCCSGRGDARFEGTSAQDALKAALADPACLMVNRNAGAGTRVLIDTVARRRAAARLRQPAEIAQRGRRGDGAGPRRLGRRHRAGGEALRPRLPAGRAGALRFPAGREAGASGRPCRLSSPRCATKRRARIRALGMRRR